MAPRIARESIAGQRPMNEDSTLVADLGEGRMLFAVADGMGGHAAGEVASGMALEVLEESVRSGTPLADACKRANEKVYARASSEVGKRGMGTTLVAMLLDGDSYTLVNVGDSRAYEVTGDGIRQVTEDHSFVAEAVRRGQPEEEAKRSRWKDALTRSIGTDAEVEVDLFGPFSAERDAAVLLCSDGLFKTLADAELRTLFTTSEDPDAAAERLVSAAFEGGSDDNISIVIVEFGQVPRRTEEEAAEDAAATQVLEPMERSGPPPADGGAGAEGWDAPVESEPIGVPPGSARPRGMVLLAAVLLVVIAGALIVLF